MNAMSMRSVLSFYLGFLYGLGQLIYHLFLIYKITSGGVVRIKYCDDESWYVFGNIECDTLPTQGTISSNISFFNP